MTHAPMSALAASISIGLMIVFFVSGVIQQKAVDRWTRDTGRAPMIHKGRGSWHKYLRSVEHEMPTPLRQRIAIWTWIGYSSLALVFIVMVVDAQWHQH